MLERSIADEVEAAIKAGSTEKHLDTLRQVTDLFLVSADGYSGEQIELFGDVLERLIRTVELRALADVAARIALAEMSTQFASIKQAPPAVVRRLANNDEISIARPVLTESARLTAEDLIELAQTKGEQHLLAISGRWWLTEVVTDALLKRHYPSVSLRLVTNPSSVTTSRSTQSAPAFRRSVRSDGHDVTVRPRATSASTSIHGAWQMAATGLPASKKCRTNCTARSSIRSVSALITPPGSMSASKSSARAVSSGRSTGISSPQ